MQKHTPLAFFPDNYLSVKAQLSFIILLKKIVTNFVIVAKLS